MPVTKSLTLYTIHELDGVAKEKALQDMRCNVDFFWMDENNDSFVEFAKWIGGKTDWSVGLGGYSWAKCSLDWYEWEYGGFDTVEWLKNNLPTKECPFTGYYMDEMILKPLHDFLDDPDDRTLEDLARECADAWVDAVVQDMEYQISDEYLTEHADANEYLFYESGRRYY